MTVIKNVFKPLLALAFTVSLFACGNSTETKDEPKKAEDTTKTVQAPTPAPAAFTPFDLAEITHTVKDYDKWRPLFNSDSENRKAAGLEDLVVGRNVETPNSVFIALKVGDLQKGKAFAADPKLKATMEKGGVISKPDIEYFHVIRFNSDSKEKQWVMITHKVKDFDIWLKAFDNEGTTARAGQGLIDVALARSIDDPNTVQIVFDIKDMAKAKASIMSEDKKKLMESAGVVGKPKIVFYNDVD